MDKMPPISTISEIMNTTNRLPFDGGEFEFLIEFIKQNKNKGLQTGIHPIISKNIKDVLLDGIVIISLDDLECSVLLVKINAGKGLFGGQKHSFISYVGSIGDNQFMAGTNFRSWGIAVTSINNIYRSIGKL